MVTTTGENEGVMFIWYLGMRHSTGVGDKVHGHDTNDEFQQATGFKRPLLCNASCESVTHIALALNADLLGSGLKTAWPRARAQSYTWSFGTQCWASRSRPIFDYYA